MAARATEGTRTATAAVHACVPPQQTLLTCQPALTDGTSLSQWSSWGSVPALDHAAVTADPSLWVRGAVTPKRHWFRKRSGALGGPVWLKILYF